MSIVTIHVWSPRPFARGAKSLTGHVSLEGPDFYASWAPRSDEAASSVRRAVPPNPRPTLHNDISLAGGVISEAIDIDWLKVDAIRSAWIGLATHHADPRVHGPEIGYSLTPSTEALWTASCATLVIRLLIAGGATTKVPCHRTRMVTPAAVLSYAQSLAAHNILQR